MILMNFQNKYGFFSIETISEKILYFYDEFKYNTSRMEIQTLNHLKTIDYK